MTLLIAVMYFQHHDSYIAPQLLLSGNSAGVLVLVFVLEFPLLPEMRKLKLFIEQ